MTHNRSTHAARGRATADRARRRTFRGCAAAAGACVLMAMSGGVAVAGNGGVSAESDSAETQTRTASNTLRPGSRGKAVKRLQRKLGLRADGVYGRGTKRAVKRFQKRNGLRADGVAGPETLRELGISLRRHSSSSDDEGSSVRLPAKLRRIAKCESGGNPRAVSADGRYRGKFQFDRATWRGLGGKGDPADAPESVQDRMALKLYRQRGAAPWGACANA